MEQAAKGTEVRPGGWLLEAVRALAATYVVHAATIEASEGRWGPAALQGLLALAAFVSLRPRAGWCIATYTVLCAYAGFLDIVTVTRCGMEGTIDTIAAEVSYTRHYSEAALRNAMAGVVWWGMLSVFLVRAILGQGEEQKRRVRAAAGYLIPPLEPRPKVESSESTLLRPSSLSEEETLLRMPRVTGGDPSRLLHLEEEAAMADPVDLPRDVPPKRESRRRAPRLDFDPLRLAVQTTVLALLLIGIWKAASYVTVEAPRQRLFAAVAQRDLAYLHQELNRGADPNAANEDGQTLFMEAAQSGSRSAVERLLKAGADVHRKDAEGRAALIYAAISTNVETVQAVLAAGAPVNEPDHAGVTPLMYAVRPGGLDVMKLLLSRGADVNGRDLFGEDSLMRAASVNLPGAVRMLLRARAEAKHVSSAGGTALMAAAQRSPTSVKLLIAAGADVNARDEAGVTPLMFAAHSADADGLDALLAAGAKPRAKTEDGLTAVLRAVEGYSGREQERVRILRALIQRGADVNAVDSQGNTPLIRVAAFGPAGLLKVLLAAGADVNARDPDGMTALMWAARGQNVEVVRQLIQAGAEVNARDGLGETALDNAVAFEYLPPEAAGKTCAQLLREAGGEEGRSGTPRS